MEILEWLFLRGGRGNDFIPSLFLISMKPKCVVLLSGGLDSRLAVKIMQERGYDVIALFFKLPFGTGCCDENCSFNFSQLEGVRLKTFDCTKSELFQEYLELVQKPKYRRGAGMKEVGFGEGLPVREIWEKVEDISLSLYSYHKEVREFPTL